ncbi:gamma-glutamyl phosphate reductase [Pterulicium gracile]|uniref:glutamate-5-semialdehyde dehydrogenase n=1 Tax=Pterulicium gracile TaxID=1884261 RepID=A0A5C3QN69_9AGAR|nr:gamma-glutamyl phosphate reductase [Pterula gracilis]
MSTPAESSSSSATSIGQAAKSAFERSQLIPTTERITALEAICTQLEAARESIFEANKLDLQAAQVEVNAGRMSESVKKRLDLTSTDKWSSMIQGVRDVAALPDPAGNVTYASQLHDDLELYRVSCPIGVLLVIFEARPEVVVNIAALAIKSGNAAILKGGKESHHTTALLAQAIATGLSQTQIPAEFIQTIQTRAEVSSLLQLDQYIDLVIPRGSNSLVKNIQNNTRIPVMGHADGICHVYLDESADAVKAVRVVVDSKTSYPSACNSAETLLIHESLLSTIWPKVATALLERDVKLQCDEPSITALQNHIPSDPRFPSHVSPSNPESYGTEFLTLTLSIATVPSLHSAIRFVNLHSSHHTDTIVTESPSSASLFCRGVDSAGTFINASTRFADGFRYGFGTEVGISTGRIHARGPVGLEGLVTYKYMLRSRAEDGHIADEFGAGEGQKRFTHTKIEAADVPFL